LFADPASISDICALGVKVRSLHEIKRAGGKMVKNSYSESIFHEGDYTAVVLSDYAVARQYLPSLMHTSPASAIIIDAASSHYLFNIREAASSDRLYRRVNFLGTARDVKLREIAVYSYADTILIDNHNDRDILLQDLPNSTIHVTAMEENKDGSHDNEMLEEIHDRGPREQYFPDRHNYQTCRIETNTQSLIENMNRGLRKSAGENTLILTDDAVMDQRSAAAMFHCLHTHPENGIVVPSFNHSLKCSASHADWECHSAKHYAAHFGRWQETRQISEPCFLIRKGMIDAVGLLDERFSAFTYACFDYCIRVFQQGYRVLSAPESFIFLPQPLHYQKSEIEKNHKLLLEKWEKNGIAFLKSMKE
jgi:hypothetical protein